MKKCCLLACSNYERIFPFAAVSRESNAIACKCISQPRHVKETTRSARENLQGEHGSEDTGQTERSWGEAHVVGSAGRGAAAATACGRAGVAWVGERAAALVLALDDI